MGIEGTCPDCGGFTRDYECIRCYRHKIEGLETLLTITLDQRDSLRDELNAVAKNSLKTITERDDAWKKKLIAMMDKSNTALAILKRIRVNFNTTDGDWWVHFIGDGDKPKHGGFNLGGIGNHIARVRNVSKIAFVAVRDWKDARNRILNDWSSPRG